MNRRAHGAILLSSKKKYGGLTDLYINQLMKEPNATKCMLGL